MNKGVTYFVGCLAVLLLFGGVLLVKDSVAQSGTGWLPFDGTSVPASPRLALLAANSQSIKLEASLPGAHVETIWAGGQPFTRLTGEGYGFSTGIGAPELPVLRQEVEIPFGAEVSITLVSAQYNDISLAELGLRTVYPLQPSQIKLKGSEPPPFTMDAEIYKLSSYAPGSPISVAEPYIVRGHRILPVEVWPVAYDPVAGSLRLYSEVTFNLMLQGSDMRMTNKMAQRYATPEFDHILSQRVLNYNQGLAITEAEEVGYLIITADDYYTAIQPLANLRASRGYVVTVTRLSELPGNTTQDIKGYIQTAYQTWDVPPSYLLLVGDTNTLPTWDGPEIKTSTDLYYATMDGEEDWHPDLRRGRFPVRSAEQTTYMVDKYLAYANLTGEEPWLKNTSFAATCDTTYNPIAEATHNYVIDSYTLPGGWSGVFPEDPQPGGDQLYCITHEATNQDLIDAYNQGRWAFVFSGHGNYSGWETGFDPEVIRSLTNNGMFSFVASHACLTGDFGELDEVFGETWVLQEDTGALAFLGSSTYTYWNEDDVLERNYFDLLFAGSLPPVDISTMTDAGLAAVELTYPDMALYYWETYNILGDPAVKLFLMPEAPTFFMSMTPTGHEVCISGTVASTVKIDSYLGYAETVSLQTEPLPTNVTASFDPTSAVAPFTSTFSLKVASGALAGDHTIDVTASDSTGLTNTASLNLRIVNAVPSMPVLSSPVDASYNQNQWQTFEWEAPDLSTLQHFQLSRSALFDDLIVDAQNLPTTSYQLNTALEVSSCYWWRARANNACGSGEWSNPFHFATMDWDISFGDDIESGDGSWTHEAEDGQDDWSITSDQSHSLSHAWFVPNSEKITDSRLWNSTSVLIGSGETLSFWHKYSLEQGFDGAVLEISTDGGTTWSDLGVYITANGYTGTLSTAYQNPIGGQAAWTGDLTTWTEVTVDLSNFAGQNVNIRWRLGCDRGTSVEGWWIDDVRIASVLPLAPAPIVLSIDPDHGTPEAGIEVMINGAGFSGTPSVRLDDVWLEGAMVVDENTITAIIPAGLQPGVYDLTLYNGDCQEAILLDAFTVTDDGILYTVFVPVLAK